jgi:hypothetical protein
MPQRGGLIMRRILRYSVRWRNTDLSSVARWNVLLAAFLFFARFACAACRFDVERQGCAAEFVIAVDEPAQQLEEGFSFPRLERTEENFMGAPDIRLKLTEQSFATRRDNRGALTAIFATSCLADQAFFFQSNEYVPHIDAIDSALRRDVGMAQTSGSRDDREDAPLIWRDLPFVKLQQKNRDVYLMNTSDKKAGTAPKNSVFQWRFQNFNARGSSKRWA